MRRGKILEETVLRGFDRILGVGGQVGDHKNPVRVLEDLRFLWIFEGLIRPLKVLWGPQGRLSGFLVGLGMLTSPVPVS